MIISYHKLDLKKVGEGFQSPTLSNVIGWYRYSVTKQINVENKSSSNKFFQRSYFDRVIRDEEEYQAICYYIETNPEKWKEDKLFNK